MMPNPSSPHTHTPAIDSNAPKKHTQKRRKKKRQGPAPVPLSPAVMKRLHDVDELVATLSSCQKETVTRSLEKRLATVLRDGEEMPDLQHLFVLLERLTAKAGDELNEAELGRSREALARNWAYHERRQATARLRAEIIQLRKTLVDLYGSQACRDRFGWGRRTARGHYEVYVEAREIIFHLRRAQSPLPPPKVPGIVIDSASWIAALEPLREDLSRAMDKVNRLRCRAQGEAIARQEALEECDETYLAVMQTSEALFRLAGEHFLRERLRPKKRRVRSPAKRAANANRSEEAVSTPRVGLATLLPWRRKPRSVSTGSKPAISLPERWPVLQSWKMPLYRLAIGVGRAGIA